jgi:ABC-type transport system involved in multi-copper enzyme maturation permease subunit
MIWLTWRQARTQTLAAFAAFALLAIYLVFLGHGIHDFYDGRIVGCTGEACAQAAELFEEKYFDQITLAGVLLIAVPGALGVFWGAPLITRELEAGTHRLVWNQSVTRTRWLTVKLGLQALFSLILTGLFSVLLTWAADPFDTVVGSRFSALTFDSRDLAPLGYALFGFALGTTVGLLVRRTLPAMALTLAVFATAMIVMPLAIRPHLMSPVTTSVAFTTEVSENIHGIGSNADRGVPEGQAPMGIFDGYTRPGAWMLSSKFSPLLKPDGTTFTMADNKPCMTGDFRKDMACLAKQNLHFEATYHPASRYWPFQLIETATFALLAALLVAFAFRRLPRMG